MTEARSIDLGSKTHPSDSGFTDREWWLISLAALAIVPFVLIRFVGVGAGAPLVVAPGIGIGIVAAAFFLAWATEGLEASMPIAVALAVLALIEVAPEYTIEVLLAYRGQTHLAAASMTGANRLLLGLGWPLILFIAYFSARRRGQAWRDIRLDSRHAPIVAYLLMASLYAFVIVLKRTLSLVDSIGLIALYVLYVYTSFRRSRLETGTEELEDETEAAISVGARTKQLPIARRVVAIAVFLAIGAVVLLFGAEPFVDALLALARGIGVSDFALLQWVAPFLSEFPESTTAFFWAAAVTGAALGLGNLMSSKLNQWTLLIAAIPIAYSVGLGHVAAVPLTAQSVDEIFLTATQSLFGTVLLLTLRFRIRDAVALAVLFFIQFFVPIERVHVFLAWFYIALTGLALVLNWRDIRAARVWRSVWPRFVQGQE